MKLRRMDPSLTGETVPPLRWLGILVIIAGILLVAKSTGPQSG